MPLIITTRRRATIAEPNIKSSDSSFDFLMLANAKHEMKFHSTIKGRRARALFVTRAETTGSVG